MNRIFSEHIFCLILYSAMKKRLLTTTAALTAAAAAVKSVGAATAPLPPLTAAAGGESAVPLNRWTGGGAASASGADSSARPSGTNNKNNAAKQTPMRQNRASFLGRPPLRADHDGGPDRYIPKGAFPNSASGLWTDVSDPTDADRTEFLPASSLLSHHEAMGTTETHLPPDLHRQLTRWNLQDSYSVQPFVNGEVEYDEQQQAWRYLGFVIDCDSATDDDASWDGGTGAGCTRFIIWAAVSCKVAGMRG